MKALIAPNSLSFGEALLSKPGYLGDASDRGSVHEGYLDFQKVFRLDSDFPRKPTPHGFTEAWNHLKSFTEEGVMNFSNRRFPNPSIYEYPAFEADSSLVKKQPEPKQIIGFKMNVFSFQKAQYQEKWPRNHEVMIHSPKPAKPVLHLLQWEASRSNHLQTRPWRPGDQSTQSGLTQTFLRNFLEAKCLPSSSYSDMMLKNKQSCGEVNHLEPVQPSILISLSQELKLLEQSARTEPKVFPQSTSCPNQKHCKDHGLIVSALHENVLKPRISKQKHIFTWLKNVLLKPFHELFSLSCALKEIWFRRRHEPKLLRPKNQFNFVHDENFSNLALFHSFPNSFTPWPDFEFDKPIFGTQFTCLMLAHVLDDYPKSLDPVFDVLRIEEPFDHFFRRFDVVSLVVLNEQDKHDHFPRRASTDGCQRTWNYLWETSSNHQGSFCPNFPFTDFFLNFNSSESDLFPFGTGTINLRINPFEEEGNDATQDPDQDQLNDQDAQIRPTEVHPSIQAKQSNRAEYRINPRSSGNELRLDPRPDDRSDRTTDDLSRPTRQDKANRRARLHLEQSESDHDRNFSLLTRLVRTAHPDDRTNVLTSSFDANKDFSSTKFSKARILRLSEDLGRVKSSYVQDSSMITPAAAPPFVHLLTATNQIITDALGHLSESGPVNH